jgi:hypothetical protein
MFGNSKTLKKLTSVNHADKPATNLKYNLCSIHNLKEYLGGSDAIVVGGSNAIVVEQQRPHYLRKYTITYDVA